MKKQIVSVIPNSSKIAFIVQHPLSFLIDNGYFVQDTHTGARANTRKSDIIFLTQLLGRATTPDYSGAGMLRLAHESIKTMDDNLEK